MILDDIALKTKERIETKKREIPPSIVRERAEALAKAERPSFYEALKKPGLSFICEVKKASPSKGTIVEDFPYLSIAKEYEKAGADAISCLTEPFWFKGSDRYLEEIVENVQIPVLRKDFTVDEYMVYEAKLLGASAILLIVAILDDDRLNAYYTLARELGLDVLVETHDEYEIEKALGTDARIIGVNNRNLKDFTVDINNGIRLRKYIPKDKIFISESGIRTEDDIAALYENGTDAVLIGETLMRASDRAGLIKRFKR